MTPERLEAVREHLETTGYSHAFKPQAFELLEEVDRLRAGIEALAHVDHLTAENARLRRVLDGVRDYAEYRRSYSGICRDVLDLLNPPTEGADR